jgi:hypothetical protein
MPLRTTTTVARHRTVAAVGLAAALALSPATAATADAHASDAGRPAGLHATRTMSCSAGAFTGSAEIATSGGHGQFFTVSVLRYKIEKHAGQSGGDKANINIFVGGDASKSPDRMIQDGRWHALNQWAGADVSVGQVQFIFDKSGSDPRCTITVPAD